MGVHCHALLACYYVYERFNRKRDGKPGFAHFLGYDIFAPFSGIQSAVNNVSKHGEIWSQVAAAIPFSPTAG